MMPREIMLIFCAQITHVIWEWRPETAKDKTCDPPHAPPFFVWRISARSARSSKIIAI